MNRLLGKLALVTGASRGIGKAIAEAFADEGARVVCVSRKQDLLEEVAGEINEKHPDTALARACHVGKTEQQDELMKWLGEGPGIPDILVNNAATNPYFGPMTGIEPAAFDKTFEVNVKGPFELIRRFAGAWDEAKQSGTVVNIASVVGTRSAPLQGVYGMTKAAVISMTQTFAVELGPLGIRVNAIAPGLVETKFAGALLNSPDILKHFTEHTALHRYGQPGEIAPGAVFLASEESSYMTGQVIFMDAGYTIV